MCDEQDTGGGSEAGIPKGTSGTGNITEFLNPKKMEA